MPRPRCLRLSCVALAFLVLRVPAAARPGDGASAKNGDGRLDFDDSRSPERHLLEEGMANLGDTSYSFAVAPLGGSLTLTPLAERQPDRSSIAVGASPPTGRPRTWKA